MITTLHIKNIGIIDDLNVELGKGLNVFTGETGAGKTLIIDAINIISGGRFSKDMIRKGETYSFVELNLYLPDNELSDEGNIIVSREIHSNGKNSCKINGRLVTVTELKEFMNSIIDIHGQNDNQNILDEKNHIKYLDNFSGDVLLNILNEYQENYKKYCYLKNELKANLGDDKEKKRQLDILQYEFDEINDANLKVGEEEELHKKSKLFENTEKITVSLNEVSSYCENAIDDINNAIKSIDKISNIDEQYEEKLSNLKNIYYEIEEFSRDLSDEDDVYFDANERDEVETRIDLINSLKRKYGNDISEILEYKDKIQSEILRINNLDEYNSKKKHEIKNIEVTLNDLSNKMHLIRLNFANVLSDKVNSELQELELSNATFAIGINEKENFDQYGKDEIKFLISTNVGEDKHELSKTASGGEMSRIMLAIKTVLANSDKIPVMIFDEIDTGISGKAAKAVGQKLKTIGENHQVVCITHQPSIAAKGDENYFISKITNENRTHTVIKHLNENEVIDEIARISNGDVTDIARKHAEELRKSA